MFLSFGLCGHKLMASLTKSCGSMTGRKLQHHDLQEEVKIGSTRTQLLAQLTLRGATQMKEPKARVCRSPARLFARLYATLNGFVHCSYNQ